MVVESSIPLPPFSHRRLVCGHGAEDRFAEVGRDIVKELQAHGMFGPATRLLDVGCGCGRVARYLVDEKLESYDGFDRHPGMIAWCNDNIATVDARFRFHWFDLKSVYEELDSIRGSVSVEDFLLPFAEGSFDTVVATSVFTHMPLSETAHLLSELHRVMTDGARMLATVLLTSGDASKTGVGFIINRHDWVGTVTHAGFAHAQVKVDEGHRAHTLFVLTR